MIRKQIYIDNDQDRQIKEVKKLLGIAEAEVIRRAITLYMNVIRGTNVEIAARNESDKHLANIMNGMVNYNLKQLKDKLVKEDKK